jgi:hypothetical protein
VTKNTPVAILRNTAARRGHAVSTELEYAPSRAPHREMATFYAIEKAVERSRPELGDASGLEKKSSG